MYILLDNLGIVLCVEDGVWGQGGRAGEHACLRAGGGGVVCVKESLYSTLVITVDCN